MEGELTEKAGTESTSVQTERLSVYCDECGHDTYHRVIFKRGTGKFTPSNRRSSYSEDSRQEFLIGQCGGCDSFAFILGQPEYSFSARKAPDINYRNAVYSIEVEPEYEFLSEEEIEMLPNAIEGMYQELKIAFEQDSQTLAGIGLRIVLELVCVNQKAAGDNLLKKINDLVQKELITPSDATALHKLREIGNVSADSVKKISWNPLGVALVVMNHFLRSIYIQHHAKLKLSKTKTKVST